MHVLHTASLEEAGNQKITRIMQDKKEMAQSLLLKRMREYKGGTWGVLRKHGLQSLLTKLAKKTLQNLFFFKH